MSHRTQGRQSLFSHRFTAENSVTGKSSSTLSWSTQSAVYNMPHSPTHTSTSKHKFQAEGKHNSTESAGKVKHLGEWRPVNVIDWTLKEAAVVYSVRLLNGSSLCSGRLEVKSNQSWSSVCEADFDQQDAEVVCRELGCGPPSVLQGALYGEVEAPVWSKELQCGGHESALLDCRSSGSARNSCSPGKAVGLTCSEPVRLVGGASRCSGTLEVKHLGEWRPVDVSDWTLEEAAVVCEQLNCGLAVSVGQRVESSDLPVWVMRPDCVQVGSSLRDCATSNDSSSIVNITCSGKRTIICDIMNNTHVSSDS
uniref:SRCR domain-containing protein n=1 Tax=Pundamilia nyererei TaxID=303518 RepID=A0A3B4FY56_9CICH